MGAGDVPARVQRATDEPAAVVVPGRAPDTWVAFVIGDEARGCELRARLRIGAPELASQVSFVCVAQVPADPAVAARAYAAPRPETALERIVAAAWHEALGVPPAGSDEDFFLVGGHSLLAGEVVSRLAQALGADVPLALVFDHPTVAEQAAWLAARAPAPRAAPIPWQRGPHARLLAVTGVDSAALAHALAAVAARRGPAAIVDAGALAGRGGARRAAWAAIVAAPLPAAGPAWRATLVRTGAARALVAFAFDGRRVDAASAACVLAEVMAAYAAPTAPLWPALALAPATVADPEPDADGMASWETRVVPAATARVLGEIAHQQSADLEAALVALVAAALAPGEAARTVTLGVPATTRTGPAARGAFGALGALAPVAIATSGEASFVTLVDRARGALPRGWALAAGLAADSTAEPAASPEAIVEWRRPAARALAGGAQWRAVDRPAPRSGALHVVATPAARGALVLRVAAATEAAARGLADRLEALLAAIAARPTAALGGRAPEPAPAVAASAPQPLTHAQERLWFLETLQPGTTTNHIQRVYRIDGPLDPALLEQALAQVAARHAALRTTFHGDAGTAAQIVHGALPLEHVVDAAPPAEAARADYARPFDYARGPLWRTHLCALGPRHHVLILTIHHLIVDALSVIVWLRELAEHYHALATAAVPRLGFLASSIPEIAAWERSPAGRARAETDLAYWQRELAGARALELPLDFRRPRTASVGRLEAHALWAPERVAELRALGRTRGATLNVTLVAAAAAFLARLTGQDDLVMVVPAARRDEPGREAMIGLLVNLLPLRVRTDGDPSFAELIARTQRGLRAAIAHAESPYERIVASLGLPREPGRQPLLDVIVNMVPGTETMRRGDLRFTLESSYNSAQPCDMVIGAVTRTGGVLDLLVRCRDDLFAEVTAQRMIARFAALLGAALAAPAVPLSQLALMPPEERALSTVTWNATARPLPEVTVHALVAAQLARAPEAVAVVQGDRALTGGDLLARAGRLAAHLRARGLPAHAPIGVAVPPSPELAVAALGVMQAGAVYVPLDAAQPAARLAILARETAFVVTPEVLAAAELAAAPAPPPTGGPDDPAYIVFTSGSTGAPKGVSTTHRALVNQIAWFARAVPWQPGEVACLRSSPAFVDSLWELFGPLADGVPLVIATAAEMQDARALAAMAARHGVTRMVVVPSLLRTLLELGGGAPDFLPALTTWLATSEELAPALVRTFRAARPRDRLWNLYGASETADQVAAYAVGEPDPLRTPIGAPIDNARLYVVDAAGQPLPIGVAGELAVAGVGVSEEYLGGPREGGGRFAPSAIVPGERVYLTGDRGRWRYDGVLEYLGRIGHLLKIRGVRVDPGEVEAALLAHPELAAAVVTAAPGFDGEPRLVAHVVARGGARVDAAEIRRRLRARLPEPMIPTAIVALPALPLGPTGKVDRAALPAIAQAAALASRPPQGATEHAVALAWEHLLGRAVGAEDDFFSAGGESLLAALLGARLSERFGVELPLPVLFERPTIAAQAAWLDEAVRLAGETAIPHAPAGELLPLSFAQERLWFAAQLAPDAPAPKLRSALRIDGPLDAPRLLRALALVAQRQGALRTVFRESGGAIRQMVLAEVPRDHVDVDLSAEPAARREELVRAQLDGERGRPFDLSAGPPWRTRLLRLAPDAHVLVITMHHLVSDGISLGVWRDDLHEIYSALGADRAPELPELTVGALDVAVWQRRAAESAGLAAARRFWRETLAGATPIDLAVAPRTSWGTGAGGRVRGELAAEDAGALAELARAEQTTVFGALLAGAAALLHGLTAREDLVIGTIAAGRDRAEVRPLVGLFLNPLPLRVDASGDPTLRELVRRAGAVTRAALAHGEVPFERIVADASPERRPFRQPLFDIVLNHHPIVDPPRLGELTVRHVRGVTAPVAPYELMLRTIARAGHGIAVQLDFQRERFAEASAAAWLERFLAALRALATAPDRRLGSL